MVSHKRQDIWDPKYCDFQTQKMIISSAFNRQAPNSQNRKPIQPAPIPTTTWKTQRQQSMTSLNTRAILCLCITIFITGCQTTSEVKNASTSGSIYSALSCNQIYNAFRAYDADKQTLQSLLTLTGVSTANIHGASKQTIAGYYQSARNNANIALLVQGCSVLQ